MGACAVTAAGSEWAHLWLMYRRCVECALTKLRPRVTEVQPPPPLMFPIKLSFYRPPVIEDIDTLTAEDGALCMRRSLHAMGERR